MSNLQKLKELTNKLLTFPDMVKEASNGFSEIRMDNGTCFGWRLMIEKGGGVHKWFNSRGSVFPTHAHDSWEVFVVYEGEMHLIYNEDKKVIQPQESFYMLPGDSHSAYFPVDTWYITITIPPAKGFPV